MIDFSTLPAPQAVELLDLEEIIALYKQRVVYLRPDLEATLELETEPITILLQAAAYRELLLRQRINDAWCATTLALSVGSDLDTIGAGRGVERQTVVAANPQAIPPQAAVMESDTAYRKRILLSLDRYSTAGSTGSYLYHTLSSSAQVLDAQPVSPADGVVTVYVLSTQGNGAASHALLQTVEMALTKDIVRPLTDKVNVLSASIVEYSISGHLVIPAGPDQETVRRAAVESVQAYADSVHRLGAVAAVSGMHKALHQANVSRVQLMSPAVDIITSAGQAPYCTAINVTIGTESV